VERVRLPAGSRAPLSESASFEFSLLIGLRWTPMAARVRLGNQTGGDENSRSLQVSVSAVLLLVISTVFRVIFVVADHTP
jgi:hypothetical protein